MDEIQEARDAQYIRADRIRQTLYAGFQADIQRWQLERDDEQFLRLVTVGHLSGRALLSNRAVRKYSAYAWIDAMLAECQQHPDRERVWITIAWDSPLTWERAPNIDTVSWRNIASQHLRRCGLDGVGALEIDTWKEIAGEPGKRMVPHIHFLGWSKNGHKVNVKALAQNMCKRRALTNLLGAPSVVVKKVGQRAQDLATLGCYLSKPPAYAKNPIPNHVRSGFKLNQVKHASGSVARLIEVLSYMEIGDGIFSIGEGKSIAGAVRQQVKEQCDRKHKAMPAPSREMIARHWRRIRLTNGNRKFDDCNVITRADQRCID